MAAMETLQLGVFPSHDLVSLCETDSTDGVTR